VVVLPTLVLALWAGWWVASKTRARTPDLPIDSAVYLSTADGLRATGTPKVAFNLPWDGYSTTRAISLEGRVPVTHFPPGYPVALALTSFVAGSVRSAARLLDIALIAVNLLLVGWITARLTGYRSIAVATLPAILLLFTPDFRPTYFDTFGWLTLHRTVASEPLFTALLMIGLLALNAALTASPERARKALVIAIGAATAAMLVRYIGFVLVVVAVIAFVFLDRERPRRQRTQRAALFPTLAIAPTALFLGWAALVRVPSPRPIFFHPVAESATKPLLMLADFVFPRGGPDALRISAIAVVIALVGLGVIRGPAGAGDSADDERSARVFMQLALLLVGAYVFLVVGSRTVFDVNIPVDARLFTPIRGLWYVLVVAVAYRCLIRFAPQLVVVPILVVLVAAVVAGGWSVQRVILRQSPAAALTRTAFDDALARVPRDRVIVSNHPEEVYELTGRAAIALPSPREYASHKRNVDYERDLRDLARDLDRHGGYLVLWSLFTPVSTPPELRTALDLRLVARTPSAVALEALYEVVPDASSP
jgi:hypothetical protein